MRIALINPPNSPITDNEISIEPIDILQLATYARKIWYEVFFLDLDKIGIWSRKDCLHTFVQNNVIDVVLCVFDYHIPLHTEQTLENVLYIAQYCKSKHIITMVGWKLATYMPHKVIFAWSPVAIAIRYDLEQPLSSILHANLSNYTDLEKIDNLAFWHNEHMHLTHCEKKLFDITTLPIPDRDFINRDNYIPVRTILSSRGCMMKCTFCHVPWFRGKRQWRTVQQVLDELEYLYKRWEEKILFLDDNATVDTKRMIGISQGIVNRSIKIKWWCLSTIHSYSDELMKNMALSWCKWIHYGIEVADETMSQKINKYLDKNKIIKAVQWTKNAGIRVRTSWILDLPWSTIDHLDETLQFIEELQTEEIRLHFLVYRLWSNLHTELWIEELWPQYIHNNTPQNLHQTLSQDTLQKRLQHWLTKMQKKWYTIIDNVEKNRNCTNWVNKNGKYIALCPLQYGINR